MAQYVYRCVDCKAELDVQHSMREDPDVFCRECDGLCKRVPQRPAIGFKGAGFYHNDKNFGIKDESGVEW